MKKWFKKATLTILGGFLIFPGLITAQPAHATSNPNYSWQDMTPNLPNGTAVNGPMIFDPATQKIVAPSATAGTYVLIDPKTQTSTTITMHTSSGAAPNSTNLMFASGGYVGIVYGGYEYVDNELTGAYTGTSRNKPAYDHVQDAAGTVYELSLVTTQVPALTTLTVYKLDPSSLNTTNLYSVSYSSNYGSSQFYPFSDGAGFWVAWTNNVNAVGNLYNSQTGITTPLQAPSTYPMIPNGTGSVDHNFSEQAAYQLSTRFVGTYGVGNQLYFYTVSSSGSITDTLLQPGVVISSGQTFPLIPVDSNTVLAYGLNNDYDVVPIDNPNGTYDSGQSYGVNGNFTGQNSQYGPFSSTYNRATVVNPNTFIASTGTLMANTPSNHVFALNAGAASDPVLQSISTTSSSMDVSVTNQNNVTAGLNFQFSIFKTDGTLVSQSGWTGPNFTFSNLSAGTTYDLKVQSQNVFGQTSNAVDMGNFTTYPAIPNSPTATITGGGWKASSGNDKISISYPAVQGATGYNVVLMNGSEVLKSYDVGNNTSPAVTVPDSSNDSGLVDDAGKYEVAIQAYNSSNGQPQTSPPSAAISLVPINQSDTTAPEWASNSVTLNNGQAYTNSQAVPITINAMDGDSGISKILVSNDDISWTTFNVGTAAQGMTNASEYTVTSNWQLPPGSGQKQVYVKLIDLVGNTSTVQTGFVGLQVNTTPPTVSLAINDGQSQSTSQNVKLTITAADPAYPNSELNMSFSNDGQTWTTPMAFQSNYNYTLPSSNSANYPVFVRVSDPAANTGIGYSSIYYLNSSTSPTLGGGTDSTGGTIGGTYPTINYNGLSNVYVANSNQVSLDFSQSGASFVSVSTDNISFSSLYDVSAPFTINLPGADGLKTVYAKLANSNNTNALGAAGKIYFLVDTTSPALSLNAVGNATVTTGSSFKVQLDASDNTSPLSALQYQVNGGSWSTIPANEVITLTGFQPHSGLQTYKISIKDLAGNVTSQKITFWAI